MLEKLVTPASHSLGVSVAVCCHNSAKLLPATIARLKEQRVSNVEWEVVLIDNACTDDTVPEARRCWGDTGPAPMRILSEPRLGLSYARDRAFKEARYEIVTFVDDDNWIGPDWISTVSECMLTDPKLGAVASTHTAFADVPFPTWFTRYANYYAASPVPKSETNETWYLIGAGMSVRRSVWFWLKDNGFHPRLTDRLGNRLSTGGDIELGFAIKLAGWKVRVEPRLTLTHFMTERRLKWSYLRRLLRANGEANLTLDSYLVAHQSKRRDVLSSLRQNWCLRVGKEMAELFSKYPIFKLIGALFSEMEGDDEVAQIELRVGRMLGLLRLRSRYREIRREVANASWRRLADLSRQKES
jgi:glycosyltransferase involved in cell wall biosynthesis